MEQTIYGDIYILINFSMDFLCLYAVSLLTHDRVRIGRLSLAALIGAIYALVSLLPHKSEALRMLTDIPISTVICFVAFGYYNVKLFVKRVFLFYCISFLTGGFMSAIYYFAGKLLNGRDVVIGGRVEDVYSEIPLWIFGVCAVVCAIIAIVWGRMTSRSRHISRASVKIVSDGKTCELHGLVDSGNLLTDPLGGLPVIVVSAPVADLLFPNALDGDCKGSRIRIIPYRTTAGEGMTLGYIPELTEINGRAVGAVLACPDRSAKSFDDCEAIVPASLL